MDLVLATPPPCCQIATVPQVGPASLALEASTLICQALRSLDFWAAVRSSSLLARYLASDGGSSRKSASSASRMGWAVCMLAANCSMRASIDSSISCSAAALAMAE